MHTTRFSSLRFGLQKRLLARRVEIGVVTLTLTLIVLTCILSVLLLLHSNKVATRGYDLRELKEQQREVKLLNERLRAEVAMKQSLANIQSNGFVAAEMVNVNNLVILSGDTTLVRK